MGGKDVCTLSEPEESRLPSFEPDPKAFSGALSVRVLMPTSGSQAVPKRGILKEEDGWLTASSVELQILVSFLDLPMSMCLYSPWMQFCPGFRAPLSGRDGGVCFLHLSRHWKLIQF